MAARSHYIQACTNGTLHDASVASIAPLNRGYLYGDAVYEVWRTYHRCLFAWEEHWQRLERSAASLSIDLPLTAAAMLAEVRRTVKAYREKVPATEDVYVRLQIDRGEGPIGLDPALAGNRANYVLLVQPNPALAVEKSTAGLFLSVATALHRNATGTLDPAWKTGNYLNNILCLREARARGADEVVITNLAGEITEAAVSNIAFVRDGVVITPPLRSGILAGITREILLTKVARRAGCEVREQVLKPSDLAAQTECFLLSTTKDITPVARIDDRSFAIGPGTLTSKLKSAFADYARDYASSRPELKVD